MTVICRSRFDLFPASRASSLVGNLGGEAAVPFYYTQNVNMNRDGSANMIQWADAVRGYSGSVPPLTVPSGATAPTYDATKGVVAASTTCAMMAALSGAFSISAGSLVGGITNQAIGTVWVVGELDATPTAFWFLYSILNGAGLVGLSVESTQGAGNFYSSQGRAGNFAVSATSANDSVCRLIIATVVTGSNNGIQIPNSSGFTSTSNTVTVVNEPYSLFLFGGGVSGGSVQHGGQGSIREIGALNRTATAGDIALLKTNATTIGATL